MWFGSKYWAPSTKSKTTKLGLGSYTAKTLNKA